MNRRAFLFAGIAAGTGFATAEAAQQVEVIYVGGWDCPYCTAWKNQYKAQWLASPEYSRVKYIEVDSPRLREAYDKRFWPGDLAAVLAQLPRKNGTPRFLIVKAGKVVSNEFGESKWSLTLSRLRKLLG